MVLFAGILTKPPVRVFFLFTEPKSLPEKKEAIIHTGSSTLIKNK